VLNAIFNLPVDTAPPDISKLPFIVLVAYVFMVALVAAVTEEAGFRGFMQSQLERNFGPLVAISISAVVFWLGHILQFGGHLDLFVVSAWYFLATSALMGVMAWLTNSILPALVTHAVADFGYTLLSIWSLSRGVSLEKVVLGSPVFYVAVITAIVGMPLTVACFVQLARQGCLCGLARNG